MYSRMTDQYYAREAPLPLDIGACCRLVRAATAAAKRTVQSLLSEFFSQQTDGWHQKRCDEEIANYRERSASAVRSVNARWSKRNTNVDTNVSETYSERITNQNQNQEPVTKEVKSKDPARKRATSLPPDFGISDSVRDWAADKGYAQLPDYLEAFIGRAKARAGTYVDWDQAFMNFIREDWGGIRKAKASTGTTASDRRSKVAEEMYAHRKGNDERVIDSSAERVD